MKLKLALSLTGGHLVLELQRPATAGGVPGLLRSLLPVGRSRSGSAPHEVAARVELAASISHEMLRSRIEQALSEVRATYSGSLGGLDLEVQLGLDHAQIGVMVLEAISATSLASSTCEAYTRAWVQQMLHLDPETQVIRWQILADARKLLISCIDRHVFDALNDASLQHGLRFVSCRPAVLSAVSEARKVAEDDLAARRALTIAWTEAAAGASRSSSVQLLRFEGKQVSSSWRGWLPSPSRTDVSDNTLEGAIRRFQAQNLAEAGEAVKRLHWPSLAGDTAGISTA